MGRTSDGDETRPMAVDWDGPPVDLAHLARHTFGDTELEREVLQLFVAQSHAHLNRLKEARDAEQWRRASHTIKGSARGIGAWAVAARAEAAERLGSNVEDARCREAIIALEQEIDSANSFIRSLIVAH